MVMWNYNNNKNSTQITFCLQNNLVEHKTKSLEVISYSLTLTSNK